MRQVPDGIKISIASDKVYSYARSDRHEYDKLRQERNRIIKAAVREESRDLFLEQQLRDQTPREITSDGIVIPGRS